MDNDNTTDNVSFRSNVPVFTGALTEEQDEAHRNVLEYRELAWQTTRDGILTAEELGFDSV